MRIATIISSNLIFVTTAADSSTTATMTVRQQALQSKLLTASAFTKSSATSMRNGASSSTSGSSPLSSSRSWAHFYLGLGTLGAFAFIVQNLLAAAVADETRGTGRVLTLEPDQITVTRVNDRVLAVAVNGLNEGYYSSHAGGAGTCIDTHAPPRKYDFSKYTETSAANCANRCAIQLLLSEHRGFNYDASSGDCQCLFDDHHVPLVEQRKAEGYDVSFNGDGPIAGVDPTDASYVCYTKESSKLGAPINSYTSVPCLSDSSLLDVVTFGAVYTPETCAEHCLRFKLFATHTGFTHQTDQCACLFSGGEAPSVRKLSGSGAVRGGKKSYAERMSDMGQAGTAVCYDKIALVGAPGTDRIAVDPAQRVWINEFHFRNFGPNEPFVEIIGPKGTSATDYDLIAYQGRNGMIHNVISLTGIFDGGSDPNWGFVVVELKSVDLRKGKQGGDGLALVRKSDSKCLQLLSYTDTPEFDRSFKAKEGVCTGKASTPIGITEDRTTPLGYSLQLEGTGNSMGQFIWVGPGPSSKGEVNVQQTLTTP